MSYAQDHADAHRDIAAAGVALTFTRTVTAYDSDTGKSTQTTVSVPAVAMQVRGNPYLYQTLGLIEAIAPSLLVATDTYGDAVELGDVVPWAGSPYRVKSVLPTAPDGTHIIARVIVG